ncbi:MAG: PIN domain-containing protein [Thermoplasmata archaeon]
MVSLDSSFVIDLLAGKAPAVTKARELDQGNEPRFITPPAAVEVLVGAHYIGGGYLSRATALVESLPVLPFDRISQHEAGRLGAELIRRGLRLGESDLFIAAISIRHGERLLARDTAFARVPGLSVESY